MNGVEHDVEIKVKQTSKGVWHCDGITIGAKTFAVCCSELDDTMNKIEEVLTKHNTEAE